MAVGIALALFTFWRVTLPFPDPPVGDRSQEPRKMDEQF